MSIPKEIKITAVITVLITTIATHVMQGPAEIIPSTTGCIDLLTSRRISGRMLNLTKLESIYENLRSKLTSGSKIAVHSLLELSMQRKASIKITNNIMDTIINVPIVSTEKWELFSIKQGLDVVGKTITMMQVKHQLIAITPSNGTTFINSLTDCFSTHLEVLACKIDNAIIHTPTCEAHLIRSKEANHNLCTPYISAARIESDLAIRINTAEVLVIPEASTNISVNCMQQWQLAITIQQPSIVKVNQPCTLSINNLHFIEAPTKSENAEAGTFEKIQFDPEFHKHTHATPALPKISQTKLEALDQLGEKIKQLNDEEINTVFLHKIFRHPSSTRNAIGASFVIGIILIIGTYIYCRCGCCCCCCF